MSGKLSERFSKLASSAGGNDRARDNRVQKRNANQKDKRTAKTQERRGLTVSVSKNNNSNNNTKKGDGKKAGGLVRTRKPKVSVGKNNNKGNNTSKGNAGRNNRKGSKKPTEKKALPSADDLDKEMDTYWFAAGKGPNPEVSSLDKEMDDYFATRKGDTETAAAAPTA